MVQTTSISVLCVVLEGTGFALALNCTATMTSRISTKTVMSVMIQSRKLWNQVMLSITGDADGLERDIPKATADPRSRLPRKRCPPAAASTVAATAKTQYSAAHLALRHLHAALAPALVTPAILPGGKDLPESLLFSVAVMISAVGQRLERVRFPNLSNHNSMPTTVARNKVRALR